MKERNRIIASVLKIREGFKLKDKFILGLYFLIQLPFNFIWRMIFKGIKRPKFLLAIFIKNSDGIFYCGNDPNYFTVVMEDYEPELKNIRLNKGIFIDIGANIGKYAVRFGNQLKGNGTVIAIEPEAKNFEILKRNISLNKLGNVIPIKKGCFSKKGILNFYLDDVGIGRHSLVNKEAGKRKIDMEVDTLDNILRDLNIKMVDLIKIDVEKAEDKVLEGAKKTLKYNPKIIFEAWDEKELKKSREILYKFNYNIKKLGISPNYCASK